jgi:hypothetical protein
VSSVARPFHVLLLGVAFALALGPPAAADDIHVVADGLDNPRGLAFGPGGDLYVAESGRGGSGPCLGTPETGETCFGTTGAVTRVDLDDRDQERIADGLPSLATPAGTDALGPTDVSFRSKWSRRGFLTIGLGGDPALRDQLPPEGAGMAWLYRLDAGGDLDALADLGAFEAANDPDAALSDGELNTNPNSVAAASRGRAVVADAGGNDVLLVERNGDISVLGVIPFTTAPAPPFLGLPAGTEIPVQSVPTSVALGKDGAVYVGELLGFPFPAGAANVWRIEPGSDPEVYLSGFTLVVDLAFGKDGSLYVLQIASDSFLAGPTPGALIRVRPDGEREELAAGQLTAPTGVALRGGNAYVSNHGTEPGTGEVVRIRLPRHEDDDDHEDHGDDHDD